MQTFSPLFCLNKNAGFSPAMLMPTARIYQMPVSILRGKRGNWSWKLACILGNLLIPGETWTRGLRLGKNPRSLHLSYRDGLTVRTSIPFSRDICRIPLCSLPRFSADSNLPQYIQPCKSRRACEYLSTLPFCIPPAITIAVCSATKHCASV